MRPRVASVIVIDENWSQESERGEIIYTCMSNSHIPNIMKLKMLCLEIKREMRLNQTEISSRPKSESHCPMCITTIISLPDISITIFAVTKSWQCELACIQVTTWALVGFVLRKKDRVVWRCTVPHTCSLHTNNEPMSLSKGWEWGVINAV